MTAWPVVTVERLCSRVTSGGTPSRSKPEYYEPGEHLWVKSKELVDRSISDTEELISDAGLRGSSAKPIQPNTVLMAMYGANVGQLGWLQVPATVNQAICAMETDPEVTDGRWLFYSLMHWRPALTAKAHGAAQQNLSQGLIREFGIPTPPLHVQRNIAAVLAAYDELIENNLRRIEILERMAQAVYREWFVNFRFPGHEKVGLVESPLGPIPEGWEVVTMSDFTTTQYGYTASTEDQPIGPKFLRGMDFNKRPWIDWSEVPYCRIPGNEFKKYKVKTGDVLVIRMADPGKVGIVEKDVEAVFASYVVRVTPDLRQALPYWLFYFMSSPAYQRYISGAGTGTTRKSASAGVLTGAKMVLPPVKIQAEFVDAITPLRRLLNNLIDQNANLRATRDLLLPKLVSGEIDVSDLDIDTEWLAS